MAATTGSLPRPGELKKELDPNAYIIGEQDGLVITVWKEKELSGGVVVRPDGKITVPLVGEVKVVGMTPVQLQSLLAEKLKPFVTVPQVSVAVTEIRSRKVYLIGHSSREGPFMINSSTTVLQIIAQAGGVKDFAKRKKIYVLRQHGNEQLRFPFNYDDVIKGKHVEQNILLEPGDTIVVP
jgi:polysaccharide export outer membrane protein